MTSSTDEFTDKSTKSDWSLCYCNYLFFTVLTLCPVIMTQWFGVREIPYLQLFFVSCNSFQPPKFKASFIETRRWCRTGGTPPLSDANHHPSSQAHQALPWTWLCHSLVPTLYRSRQTPRDMIKPGNEAVRAFSFGQGTTIDTSCPPKA